MRLRYIATFHPQAWVNDRAVAVDPQGPTTFDVTADMSAISKQERLNVLEDRVPDLDWLRDVDSAPAWVREWSGPFEVTVAIGRLPADQVTSHMPREIVRLCVAWDVFTDSIKHARAASKRIRVIEEAPESYLSVFEWEGARWDEGRRTAKRAASRIAEVASRHFAPDGQRLEIAAEPLTAALEVREQQIREEDRDSGRAWDDVARDIDSAWLAFCPRQAWAALRRTYGGAATQIATNQAVECFLRHFRRDPRGTAPIFTESRRGAGVLQLDAYAPDGYLTHGSTQGLYQGLDTLARVIELALPDARRQGMAGPVRALARSLGSARALVSRGRFDLGPVGHAVTFKERVEIHLAPDIGAAIALLIADVAPRQAA